MNTTKATNYAKKIYDKEGLSYSSKTETIRLEKMATMVGSSSKVLDIGCWDGTLGSMLIERGNEVYGIEINEEVAEIAKKRGLKVKIQDINFGFDFEDNFFDVVVAAEIIEHILDTDFFIDNIRRVLKPGGFLVLSTPNAASLGRRIMLLLGKNPYFEASLGYPPYAHAGHIRFFTKKLLLGFLEYKGFEIVKFESDAVNVTYSGKIAGKLLADVFPTLGKSLIVKAKLITN